ncbi:MAG: PEP/pyruvate-binding domain-containing protein [Phycisphaerae bacterium]
MAQVDSHLSTGIRALDRVLRGLIPGDNIVWEVGSVEDYRPFIEPYARFAHQIGQKLVYIRFAGHPPLMGPESGAEIHELDPEGGFEAFIQKIHKIIERTGRGGYYVFDCLSELAEHWYSDQMVGNFFMLTCPYLLDMEAIAYFAILRDYHSFHATGPISETTQVFLDTYRHDGKLYVQPVKVQQRYSPTMNMLHLCRDDEYTPISDSATIAEILATHGGFRLESAGYRIGVWNRAFLKAEEMLAEHRAGKVPAEQLEEYRDSLLRMCVSRDERVLDLAEKHFTLEDVLMIGKHMVGTGLIGGKSVGMLLSRAILRNADSKWKELLEPHDSFYLGSDVFYTFLVQNGIWFERERQKDPETFLVGTERARHRMTMGSFPDYIQAQFEDLLDYFGQSPIIVRSSSLLEDNFGNAFAGKYESVFCVNQGPKDKRLDDLMTAVKTIYASTMSEKALSYRSRRGLLDMDEQMALLVQRVSGRRYGNLFYPQMAGVGLSHNPYVWNKTIDPKAGVLRVVFGLGTRAVDRSDDDYTRVVALNAPERRVESNFDEVRQYSQKRVDVLDLQASQQVSNSFQHVLRESPRVPIDIFASQDRQAARRAEQAGLKEYFPWVLTFEQLLDKTDFVDNMRQILQTLQQAYEWPVDMEFTTNFYENGRYRINIVQCRPLQIQGDVAVQEPPSDIPPRHKILDSHSAVVGQGRLTDIDRLIYVSPEHYGQLEVASRYNVARLIGKITAGSQRDGKQQIMLMGPGRWGTSTPTLGIPVRFAEISPVSVLCEIVAMRKDLVPDVSLGTHFLNELVENQMLYLAFFPNAEGNSLNEKFFAEAPNHLRDLLPDWREWDHMIKVIDAEDIGDGLNIHLNANTLKQHVVCYIGDGQHNPVEARVGLVGGD